MNRILFVGFCLAGIVGFAFVNAQSDLKKQPETKIVKEQSNKVYY